MSEDEILLDGMPDWMADHARRYLKSNGEDGYLWDASVAGASGMVQTCLLFTKGRKSGRTRVIPLIYGDTDGGVVVIGSKGGAPDHPAWYLNLLANPEIDVQVRGDRFRAKARLAEGDERARLWDEMVEIYSPYTEYQARTDREIPVIVLDRL